MTPRPLVATLRLGLGLGLAVTLAAAAPSAPAGDPTPAGTSSAHVSTVSSVTPGSFASISPGTARSAGYAHARGDLCLRHGPAGAALAARSAEPASAPVTRPAPDARAQKDPELVRLIGQMTLEEKVGQLFVTYAYGDKADTTAPADVARNRANYGVDNAAQLIAKYHLGGVIYFAWSNNTVNPRQIAGLSNGIQRAAMSQRIKIPALISTDQEGGSVVSRIGPPAVQFPGSMALGAGRRVRDAHTAAHVAGTELRAMGVNQVYAPVADVNVNPANPVIGVRSFSADPQVAAGMTARQVGGYQAAGVAATSKHFPGHGDTAVDSHTGVPVITHTRQEWEALDLPPFRAAVDSGIDSIMTGHLVVPALDASGDPSTLSRPILTGLLREQLGYDGLVVTDSLGMQGVRDKYGDDRIPVLAFEAGVDQLLKSPDGRFDLQYNAVLAAVRAGELSEARIDESVYRVLRLKKRRGLFTNPYADESKVDRIVGAPAHLAAAQRVTDPTTTLVKNDPVASGPLQAARPLLPLPSGGARQVLVTGWNAGPVAEAVGRRQPGVGALDTGLSPSQATIDAAVARAATSDLVIVATNRAWDVTAGGGHNGPGQRNLVNALLATGKPVIVVALRDPYDIGHFTAAPAFVTTFSYTASALESLARVLYGERSPTGRLPVRVPAADDPNQTLYPYGHGLSYG
jgi:beta-N-acetylhexosaminidase